MESFSLLAIFGLGPWELGIMALVVLLLFGNRLPSVMRNLGRGAKEFREGLNNTDETQNQEAIS